MVNHIHHWPSPSGVVWFSRPAGTWGPGCSLCRNRKRNQPTGHKLDINSTPSPNLLKYQGQRHPSPTPISHATKARHQTQNSIQTTFSASDGSSKLRRARGWRRHRLEKGWPRFHARIRGSEVFLCRWDFYRCRKRGNVRPLQKSRTISEISLTPNPFHPCGLEAGSRSRRFRQQLR